MFTPVGGETIYIEPVLLLGQELISSHIAADKKDPLGPQADSSCQNCEWPSTSLFGLG